MDTQRIETPEDLITRAAYDERRYQLNSHTAYVWDDPTAGRAWTDAHIEIERAYRQASLQRDGADWEARLAEVEALLAESDAARPGAHTEEDYYLISTAHQGRGPRRINLSLEVGRLLNTALRLRNPYKTLVGWLRGTNLTDIEARLQAARQALADNDAREQRNAVRREILRRQIELERYVADYGATVGVTVSMFAPPNPTWLDEVLTAEKAPDGTALYPIGLEG